MEVYAAPMVALVSGENLFWVNLFTILVLPTDLSPIMATLKVKAFETDFKECEDKFIFNYKIKMSSKKLHTSQSNNLSTSSTNSSTFIPL